jgi:nitrate/nitrite transporter NarK
LTASSAPARLSDHVRPTAAHRRILVFAWGAWCTGFYSLMLLSFVLKAIQDELGLSKDALAPLTAVGVGMTGVGGLLFGWMSDRACRWRSRSRRSRWATWPAGWRRTSRC